MLPARLVLVLLGLLFAVVLQTSGFPMLGLPGAAPAVVLVLVASIAICRGRSVGMFVGFAGGLLVDIAPPADHPIGRLALTYCIVGYVMGAFRGEGRRSAFLPMALVAVGAVLGSALDVLFGTVFGYGSYSLHAVTTDLPLAVLYDVVLTPFIFPVVTLFDRLLMPRREMPL